MTLSRTIQPFTDVGQSNGVRDAFPPSTMLSGRKCIYERGTILNSQQSQRQQRYQREEGALSRCIVQCPSEKPVEVLQSEALGRVVALLATEASQSRERLTRTKKKLQDENLDKVNYDALLKDRWMEERVLARVTEEHDRAKKALDRLAHSSWSPDSMRGNVLGASDHAVLNHRTQISRSHANLELFLQKSATLRPLRMERRFANTQPRGSSINSTPTSRSRKRSLTLRQSTNNCRQPSATETRANRLLPCENLTNRSDVAHSGMMGPYERKFSVCSSITPTLRTSSDMDDLSATGHTSHTDFTVVLPTSVTPHASGHNASSLCDEIKQAEHNNFGDHTVHPQTCSSKTKPCDESEPTFGSIAIWREQPRCTPSLRSRSRLRVLDDVPVPTYAQSLMDNFVRRKIPNLRLTQPNNHADLTGLTSATASFQDTSPSIRAENSGVAVDEAKSAETPRSACIAADGKRRSLFSLQLPIWPTDSSSPLEAKTAVTPKDLSTGNQTPRRTRLRKGLPSTRAYDLSQQDAAPDDIPTHGAPSGRPHLLIKSKQGDHPAARTILERTSKRNSLLAPISALKRMGSRISMLNRK